MPEMLSDTLMTPTSDWDVSAAPCEDAWTAADSVDIWIFLIFDQLISEFRLPIQDKGGNESSQE